MNKLLSVVTAAAIMMLAGCSNVDKVNSSNSDPEDTIDQGINGIINAQSSSSLKLWNSVGTVYHITGSVQIQTDVVWDTDIEVLVDADAKIRV